MVCDWQLEQEANISIGNFRVNSKADIPEALEALKDRPLYAEKWAYFKMVSHTLRP
jgi:hypothetical protein